ncbi:MAG: Bax inhibitor-1/YccA family protein [Desulfovibrionaceae bacterium]|nr:Bax inhibitor-1/YccA family protein [Desulfovibrionaceae bacterium]
MSFNFNTQARTYQSTFSVAAEYMRHVYTWMTVGLVLTACVALAVASSPSIAAAIFSNSIIPIVLIVAQFGIVIAISAAVHRMSAPMATAMFLLYAALTGVTLSSIFIVYPIGSIANAFFTCAGMFLAMSIYGTVTKRDLSGMGTFLFMGLIGIIIASIVNIFLGSSMMDFVISVCGVLVFTGLTAYDTQKLRQFGAMAPLDDGTAVRRGAILGALTLYLDFINLFLMLLRLFSGRSE